jgi:hypothetical protein
MDKIRKLPREGVADRRDDGLSVDGGEDTESHRYKSGNDVTRLPGTGGDAFPRRPSGGGELTEDDVEGHKAGAQFPGTGGDAFPRRPSSGGEIADTDDVGR